VRVDVRPHLDLFDLDDLLLFLRLGLFLLLLVFEFSEIEDLADGRLGSRGDFDQIETRGLRDFNRLRGRNDAALLASFVDQKDLWNAYLLVDAGAVAAGFRGGGGGWSAGYGLISFGCSGLC
jgi:hypothetical protein